MHRKLLIYSITILLLVSLIAVFPSVTATNNAPIFKPSEWISVAPKLGDETRIICSVIFNNELYAGTFPNAKLYKWNSVDAWIEVAGQAGSESRIQSLAVYNGKIYGGTQAQAKLFEWNGVDAWVQVAGQYGSTEHSINDLIVYNGSLYGGTNPNGYLLKWNDIDAWVKVADTHYSQTLIMSFAIYNGYLYGGTGENSNLFRWNNVDAWDRMTVQLGSETHISSLAVYNGCLYGGTSPNGKLYKYDDVVSWIEVAGQVGGQSSQLTLGVYNNNLYGGTAPNAKLYKWNDIDTWLLSADTVDNCWGVWELIIFNDLLYGAIEGTGDLYRFTQYLLPLPNAVDIPLDTTLKIRVTDAEADDMTVSFYWSDETLIETITDIPHNTYAETANLSLNYFTEYNWYAIVNDSVLETQSDTFAFTTTLPISNFPPNKPTCVSPTHNEDNVLTDTTLKVHVTDTNNDNMTVSFYWSDETLIETVTDITHDSDVETSNLSLNYLTEYNWYAIANDSELENQSDTFTFTTIIEPNFPPVKPTCVLPINNSIDVSITTTLKVHVIDIDGDTMSVSFYWSNNTLIETVTDESNDTDAESSVLSLDYNTTYQWYAIANDSLLETQSDTFSFKTADVNAIPVCIHAIPRVKSDGYLYMIYRDSDINISNLNILMGSYTPFSAWKFNYTSLNWDNSNFTIMTNDYIRIKINQSNLPYNDTKISLIPQIRFNITDAENDNLNITVKSNSSGFWNTLKEWSNVSQGWFICSDSNMSEYNTTYYYTINVTDSHGNNVDYAFSFVTTSTEPAIPPIVISDMLIYTTLGIIILAGIGGSMYILSKKKR